MRKLGFAIAVGALVAASPAAFADDELISIVQGVNAGANTMTLLNNTAYKLPASVKVTDIKRGQVVRITFTVGVNTANSVVIGAAATGTVKSLDEEKGTVTLDDGKVYWLLPIVDLDDVKPGKKVKLEYAPRLQDNAMMVANVLPAG